MPLVLSYQHIQSSASSLLLQTTDLDCHDSNTFKDRWQCYRAWPLWWDTWCKRRQTQTQTCTELTCFTSFLLSKPFNILSNSCCGKFPLRRWISFRQIPAPNVICTLRPNYTTKPNMHHKSLLNRFCTCQGHCVAFFHTVWPVFLCNWYDSCLITKLDSGLIQFHLQMMPRPKYQDLSTHHEESFTSVQRST